MDGKNVLSIYLALLDDPRDSDFFEYLYMTYKKQMLSVAFDVLKNNYDSEDAVHNAFISVAKRISELKEKAPNVIRAYLCRSARNSALNIYSKRNRVKIFEEPLSENENISALDDELDVVIQTESFERIVNCIKALPDTYRDTLYLFYVDELTAAEIAVKLNREKGTVKKQIYRGKKVLLDLFAEEGVINK